MSKFGYVPNLFCAYARIFYWCIILDYFPNLFCAYTRITVLVYYIGLCSESILCVYANYCLISLVCSTFMNKVPIGLHQV
jgi:hypothetical protein